MFYNRVTNSPKQTTVTMASISFVFNRFTTTVLCVCLTPMSAHSCHDQVNI